jgi:DNA-binding GntR family transcriptional regulator
MTSKLSDKAYSLLTRKLMAGELAAGQKISEQRIASECGISRTPVREAIQLLIDEGLFYQVPSSGTYVAHLDRQQIIDTYEVRMAIECFTIERAIPRLDRAIRGELQKLCAKMYNITIGIRTRNDNILDGPALVEFLKADLSFHLLLMNAAGNRLTMRIVKSAYQRNLFFGHHSHRRDFYHLAWIWRHHARIERAAQRGDVESARFWMREHIARSMRDALAAFDTTAPARMPLVQRDPIDDELSRLIEKFE